jgi:hypothetical protein
MTEHPHCPYCQCQRYEQPVGYINRDAPYFGLVELVDNMDKQNQR